jgi:putative tricarboxylic transport membrane protein
MAIERIKKASPYILIFLICMYFYSLAGKFQFVAKAGNIGPDFWPKMLLALTMAVCLYEIIKTAFFSRIKTEDKAVAKEQIEDAAETKRSYPGLLLIGTLMTVLYVYLVTILGFTLCTFLYFALFMFVGRYRKKWAILANSVIGTLVLIFIFMKIVYVSLPLGQEPFSAVTFFVLSIMGIK